MLVQLFSILDNTFQYLCNSSHREAPPHSMHRQRTKNCIHSRLPFPIRKGLFLLPPLGIGTLLKYVHIKPSNKATLCTTTWVNWNFSKLVEKHTTFRWQAKVYMQSRSAEILLSCHKVQSNIEKNILSSYGPWILYYDSHFITSLVPIGTQTFRDLIFVQLFLTY